MDEKKRSQIKNCLAKEFDLSVQDLEICDNVLTSYIHSEDASKRTLFIQAGSLEGALKRFHFDFISAITFLQTIVDAAGQKPDLKFWVGILLSILAMLFNQESTSLNNVQVMIILELYAAQQNGRKTLYEDSLYECVRNRPDSYDIDRRTFEEAVEALRKLRCIEITQGSVTLTEKIRL